MPVIKSEAIILKCDNYRETSKIVTFYSLQHGKLRGIAKGVRDTKTKWGGVLQPMAHVNMMYYFKENRTLHLVSGAEYVKAFTQIYDDFEKLQTGYRIIEMVNKTTEEHHENRELFELLAGVLERLNGATKNYVNLLFNYEFNLAKLLGFGINMEEIQRQNLAKDNGNQYFYNLKLSAGDIKALGEISLGNFNRLRDFNISKSQEMTLEKFFENYFISHFESTGFSNTKKVFRNTNNTKIKNTNTKNTSSKNTKEIYS
jgi:DNA repair protein RecO